MLSFDAQQKKAFLPGEVDFFPQEGKVCVGVVVRVYVLCVQYVHTASE